jgi:hypothetical protein
MKNNITTTLNHDGHYRPFAGKQTAEFSLADNTDSLELLRKLVAFVKQTPQPYRVSEKLAAQFVYLAYWKNIHIQLVIEHTGPAAYVGVKFPKYPLLGCAFEVFDDAEASRWDLGGWLSFFRELVEQHREIWQIDIVVDGQFVSHVNEESAVAVEIETDHIERVCL